MYLGAANGTTVSHVSDIVSDGMVFAVEFSSRAMHDLIKLSEKRINLMPIFEDATKPEKYKSMVSKVDVIYQDISQREQGLIALKNSKYFLKKNGLLILLLKLKNIDSISKTKEIISHELDILNSFFNLRYMNLKPFYSEHIAVVGIMR